MANEQASSATILLKPPIHHANDVHRLANIIGAVNVHAEDSWPDMQRVFVMCTEPRNILTHCDSLGAFAYE